MEALDTAWRAESGERENTNQAFTQPSIAILNAISILYFKLLLVSEYSILLERGKRQKCKNYIRYHKAASHVTLDWKQNCLLAQSEGMHLSNSPAVVFYLQSFYSVYTKYFNLIDYLE